MNRELRRKIVLVLVVCLLCGLLSGYASVDTPQDGDNSYGKLSVYVDEELEYTGYVTQSTVYVPLRSFCGALNMGAVVSWNESTDTMSVTMTRQGTTHTMTAKVGDIYLYVNDRIVYLSTEILSRRGNVLVPLDGLCTAFGISAVREEEVGVHLCTDSLQLCSRGSEVYDPDDLKWLSHIINAEAGNQSLEGQICVGNVVLNRVANENFPDTVRDVIFSPNQFCPVKSGTIYCTPDADAIAAAKLCLEGVNLAGESTYFVNPRTGSTAWFREHLTYAMSVGEHDFYY